jgi:light-regulated signal transduction histidine kinase (bacteriophytochrome)
MKEPRRERLDLSKLAHKVAEDVRTEHPEVEVEISIQPSLIDSADSRLMSMALYNLFDNAVKYRKTGIRAKISFGATDDGSGAYFVKDEGIGFEMAYVGKLFKAFERLHRDTEYPGTGIGLANVRRAIERHGGRVWAEGELGVGASFYFTLR